MTKRELIAKCEETHSCDSCDYKHDCNNFMEEQNHSPAYYTRIYRYQNGVLSVYRWLDDKIQEHFV